MNFEEIVRDEIAEMFAQMELRKYRRKCQCEKPKPTAFDQMDFSDCEKCGGLLSFLMFIERQ